MARLTRKNIKVFAGEATNNGVFGSLQANNPTISNDVEQIQSLTAWSEGWDSATETSEMLPPLEEFQGVQYVTTYQQAYIMQEGLPEWATTVTYYKGCLVKKVTTTGFQIYNSLTDNNTGNLLSDTSNWKLVMDSDNLYAFDSAVVHKTGNETVAGVKTFSSSPVVPDGVNSTDAVSKGQMETALATKANTSDVVNLTGTQTISGAKTFTGVTTLPAGTTISNQDNDIEGGEIAFKRANNDPLAQDPRLDLYNGLMRFLHCNGVIVPASDVGGTAVSTAAIYKAANGYVKLGNGLIIQWGYSTIDGAQVTLLTPFSNTNYRICATYMKSSGSLGSGYGHVVTYPTYTTSFYANTEAGEYQWIAIGY